MRLNAPLMALIISQIAQTKLDAPDKTASAQLESLKDATAKRPIALTWKSIHFGATATAGATTAPENAKG